MGLRDRLKRLIPGRAEPAPPPPAPAPPPPPRPAYRSAPPEPAPPAPPVPAYRSAPPEPAAAPAASPPPEADPPEGVPVRLLNPALGLDHVIHVLEGEFVLDAADREGLDLPYSCRNGGCTVCAGRLVEGEAAMGEEQYTLEAEHLAAGFRLLCCTLVSGPATFTTHQSEEVQ